MGGDYGVLPVNAVFNKYIAFSSKMRILNGKQTMMLALRR